jgi:signal peptidase I
MSINEHIVLRRPSFSLVTESLLAAGLSVRFRAHGRSMSPAVRDGECVTVAPVDVQKVSLGDVLLCETWRGPVAHRVIEVEDAPSGVRFATAGDASDTPDRPVEGAQVRGRLVSVDRDGKTISLALAGGRLGRRAFLLALRARKLLGSIARAVEAGARAPSIIR